MYIDRGCVVGCSAWLGWNLHLDMYFGICCLPGELSGKPNGPPCGELGDNVNLSCFRFSVRRLWREYEEAGRSPALGKITWTCTNKKSELDPNRNGMT